MEEELWASEASYRAAEKMAHLGHWERDFRTGKTFWSAGVCDVFGLPAGSAAPPLDDFLALVHPEDRVRLNQEIEAALASGQALDAEFRIRRPDGELRYIHTRGMPVRDASGEFNILSGVLQDITDRKRAEGALRESEGCYRSFVTSSMDAVLLTAQDGRILAANEAACRMFGRSEQELMQVGQSGVVDGLDPRMATALEERARTGRFRGELTLMRKDGTKFPGEVSSAHFTGWHGELRTSMVIRDVTERVRMEEELRENEASARARADELAALLAATPALIFIAHDPACRRMTSSDAALRVLRLPHDANTSKSAPPGERPRTFRALKNGRELRPKELPVQLAAATGKAVKNFEMTLAFEDGTSVDTVGDAVPLFDAEGKVRGAVGAFLDITERKRAEEKTRRLARELLVVRENERRQVSSALHHDVGSLAVGIAAHLDAIDEGLRCGKSEEALKWTKRIRELFDESVGHLRGLAIQLRPPELDVLGLPAALRQHFSQITECGQTRIHFRETLGRRRVDGDTATILFRIAQEALTNAITHGEAKRVDVSLRALKKEVRLTVRDNGTGFDPSENQVRQTSHMGLRVIQEMVTYAGGACLIDSKRGKGTTLRVSLPLSCGADGASGDGESAGSDDDGG
ncbi:MAG: PAS domain S-box protein [Candidatus Brocadiia bacterium]